MDYREFRQESKTGKTRVWRIGVDGPLVCTEFGELGGQIQQVGDMAKGKNIGRANEVSPEEAAVQMMERELLLKCRAGYVEVGDEDVFREDEINFNFLPTNLTFYKPDNSLSTTLSKKLESGKAWLSRKRDGECMVICIPEQGDITIYSRKMLKTHDKENTPWNVRFHHICEELAMRVIKGEIPTKTILLGEMVMDRGGDDDRWHVASVMKSLTPKSVALQMAEGRLSFYVWDIAFWDGEDMVKTRAVRDRYELIDEKFTWGRSPTAIIPVDYLSTDDLQDIPEEEVERSEAYNFTMGVVWNRACHLAHTAGWEGWVVVDPEGIYGDAGYNFRGKTDRPGKYCGKLKPVFEDDFIVKWAPENKVGSYGTGKYQGLIGSVELFQYNADGELTYICECGNGFSEKDLKMLSDMNLFPMVMAIEYTSRTYKSEGNLTNALQFPTFICVREDKTIDEVINARL